MIEAVFFDIDGTLTDYSTGKIPPAVFHTLDLLKKQGIKLVIATGRGKDGLGVLEGFSFDGYITLNGQYCFDTSGNVIYKNAIPKEAIIGLLKELQNNPVPCAFQMEHRRIFNFRDKKVDYIHQLTGNDDHPAGDLTGIENEAIYQCMIFMEEDGERKLMEKLPMCHSARWHPYFFDLSPKGGTKVKGMDIFLDHFNIPLDHTMAFGDGGNDIEMIEHASIGIAMENGTDALKQHADYVTAHTVNGGIEDALYRYDVLKG